MFAGQDGAVRMGGLERQAIAAGRSYDFLAAGPEDGNVLHEALPAHAKALRQFSAAHRTAVRAHPFENPAAALARVFGPRRFGLRRMTKIPLHSICLVRYLV